MTEPTSETPAAPAAEADDKPGFETLLRDLETVVGRLERGEQSLEDALADFERGTALAAEAGKILDAAQARVAQLTEAPDGTLEEVPFDAESE